MLTTKTLIQYPYKKQYTPITLDEIKTSLGKTTIPHWSVSMHAIRCCSSTSDDNKKCSHYTLW